LIQACAHYQLSASTTSDTGVWIGNDKIAALGIQVRRYLTSHGFALNCDVDLSWFSHIIPCGLTGKGVTSIARELARLHATSDRTVAGTRVEDVLPVVVNAMAQTFHCQLVPLEQLRPDLATEIDQLLEAPSQP
jgi:lipoate-protein ligase B